MKCLEVFYSPEQAEEFVKSLDYEEADPEVIQTTEETDIEGVEYMCWAVYFNPRKMEG